MNRNTETPESSEFFNKHFKMSNYCVPSLNDFRKAALPQQQP